MPTATDATSATLRDEMRGLDRLELALPTRKSIPARIWYVVWPKLAAVALFFFVWQCIVWSGWKAEYLLPSPATVLDELFSNFGKYVDAAVLTLRRALWGFSWAVVIGIVVGALVARINILRRSVGSMITGLMTMPSIAWFPLAIIVIGLNEKSITFVIVLGAAPSIANGLISGIDNIPPIMLRTGRVLGAHGLATFRHVVFPAALPTFMGGVKQGWAFAWRSLLAGELLVLISGKFSLGQLLQTAADFNKPAAVMATMMVLFFVGVVMDALVFATAERAIRKRYGFVDEAAAK